MSKGNQLLTKDEWNADIKRMIKEDIKEIREEKAAKGKKPWSKKREERYALLLWSTWSL